MGSKKHKKHHKSEKKELSLDERTEKPLKLVLKVGGSIQSPVHASNSNSSSSQIPRTIPIETKAVFEESKLIEKSASHSHEKHKKSKKKKKKKSTDKDRHERKRKHHHHHHHHREHSHERKEKRRKEQDSSRSMTDIHDSLSRDSVSVRPVAETVPIIPMEKPVRDARTCTLKRKAMKTSLQTLLNYLIRKLQQKDPQDFFAWPVTDVIAPGYSSIIANPIDFSTISRKNDDREYKSVLEFKADIKLMCDNAMTYNRADTVYYKSAKRLWHAAQKLMNREQFISLKRTFPFVNDLNVDELGFNIQDESEESLPRTELSAEPGILAQPEAKKSKVAPCWSSMEPEEDDDEMSPEEILQQAQRAARAAADRLTLKRPNSKFGFLRQNENGSTTLAIIHPKAGDREVKVNLEMLAGKVTQGTGAIPGYKEDSKNFVKPINYNNYGSYSSYAPQYDSTFANLSKEDSDLVLSTYGDELGVQYADSLTSFARDNDYVINMVDNILDNLTSGEHSKTVKILDERKAMKEEEAQARKALKPLNENDMNKYSPGSGSNDPQSLEEIEAELSHLECSDAENGSSSRRAAECEESVEKRKEILHKRKAFQMKLDSTTQMLVELKRVQGERLSSNPPPHLALVRPPSTAESDLADKVAKKIIDVTSQVPPENVVSVKSLRKAMGITYRPLPSPDKSSPPGVHTRDLDSELREFLETGAGLTPPTDT